jgi:hypothetical protein
VSVTIAVDGADISATKRWRFAPFTASTMLATIEALSRSAARSISVNRPP